MKTYLITYQLRSPYYDYSDFYSEIKLNYPQNLHFVETAYLLKSEDNPNTILSTLRNTLPKNDSIFIAEITDEYAGFVPISTWEFLK